MRKRYLLLHPRSETAQLFKADANRERSEMKRIEKKKFQIVDNFELQM
jgi:hypothetical protein